MTATRCVLDTSIVISLRDGDRSLQPRLDGIDRLFVSAISLAELEGGVYRDFAESANRRARLDILLERFEVLPFGGSTAQIYGGIIERIGFSRSRILDRMIASHALEEGATLATCNSRDFRDIPDLMVEDWSA